MSDETTNPEAADTEAEADVDVTPAESATSVEEAPAKTEAAPAKAKKKATAVAKGGNTESSRDPRKTRVGVVVSDVMEKTIVIDVVRRVQHPRFKKIVKRSTKLYAHDEDGAAKVGDKVRVMECRPMSKKKRWRLVEVLAH
jgi:small subunit ribosomal protein S17